MKKVLAFIATVAATVASLGSVACLFVIIDEPQAPKSLIN